MAALAALPRSALPSDAGDRPSRGGHDGPRSGHYGRLHGGASGGRLGPADLGFVETPRGLAVDGAPSRLPVVSHHAAFPPGAARRLERRRLAGGGSFARARQPRSTPVSFTR